MPRKDPWDATLSGPDGPDLAARFLTWYILEGHPGLKVSSDIVGVAAHTYISACHERALPATLNIMEKDADTEEHATRT